MLSKLKILLFLSNPGRISMVSQETPSLTGAVLAFLKLIMPSIVKGTTVFSYKYSCSAMEHGIYNLRNLFALLLLIY